MCGTYSARVNASQRRLLDERLVLDCAAWAAHKLRFGEELGREGARCRGRVFRRFVSPSITGAAARGALLLACLQAPR